MSKRGENIYRRKDGRYEGRYVVGKTEKGKTKFGYVYGRRYGEVRAALARKKAEQSSLRVQAEPYPDGGGYTLGEWLSLWLETEAQHTVKESSYQTYRTQARRHLIPALGAYRLEKVTPALVGGFVARLEASGLAINTVKGICRLLSASLRSAQEEGLILQNPCKRLRFPNEGRSEQRVLSRSEQAALRDAADGADGLPALVSLYTGMRLGEICSLKWADIDWERRTVTVRRTVQRVAENGETPHGRTRLIVGAPKSMRSCRVLPLTDLLYDLLRELSEKGAKSEYVFGSSAHAADPRWMQRRLERVAARAGLKGVHFHTLRHTFATRLLELGVDVKTVSTLLGHSSANVTLDFYAHSLPEQQRSAMEKLSAC